MVLGGGDVGGDGEGLILLDGNVGDGGGVVGKGSRVLGGEVGGERRGRVGVGEGDGSEGGVYGDVEEQGDGSTAAKEKEAVGEERERGRTEEGFGDGVCLPSLLRIFGHFPRLERERG